jgi:hypothetical protein
VSRILLLGLSLFAACAFAQPANDKEAAPPAEPAKERRPLNLRLDNPSSFATVNPDKAPSKELPALGGDARKFEPKPLVEKPQGGPFPKDSNPQR